MTDDARRSALTGQESKQRSQVDWDAMEMDWRIGIKSVLQLSKEHNVSRAAILKHWDKAGIERDLNAKIQAKADALVTQSMVTREVTAEQRVTENQIILTNAHAIVEIRLGQRAGLSRLRALKLKMLDHIEGAIDNLPELADVVEMLRNPDESGRDAANDKLRKSVDRSALIDDLKKLSEIDERVRKGECGAFNIQDGADDATTRLMKRVLLDFEDAEVKRG